SGAGILTGVEVRVFSWAPDIKNSPALRGCFFSPAVWPPLSDGRVLYCNTIKAHTCTGNRNAAHKAGRAAPAAHAFFIAQAV
ncbi:hypothetical protein, partial [Neisseria bacilliformis]|uniref:hypothetical protein n=1 Tax=Neisseria bacilliformis TaxID=267212 RepID=UPI0028EAE2DD